MSAISCQKVYGTVMEHTIFSGTSAGVGAGLAAACTTLPVAPVALFSAISAVCISVCWIVDDALHLTNFLGKSTLAEIMRTALYCILASAATAGGATLAGFTVTIGGAALFAIAPPAGVLLLIAVSECCCDP
jgi:hypothetical protein